MYDRILWKNEVFQCLAVFLYIIITYLLIIIFIYYVYIINLYLVDYIDIHIEVQIFTILEVFKDFSELLYNIAKIKSIYENFFLYSYIQKIDVLQFPSIINLMHRFFLLHLQHMFRTLKSFFYPLSDA